MQLQLIAGLGNPGQEYSGTRHNVGAWFVEKLAAAYHAELLPEKKFFGNTANLLIHNHAVRVIVPSTYMNHSGRCINTIAKYYNIPAHNTLIVHDELDFPSGIVKLKQSGGHGGHNGLRDIIKCFGGNKDFMRLRLGIGHPGSAHLVTNYVLHPPSKNDQYLIEDCIHSALPVLPLLVQGHWDQAVQKIHAIN